MKGLLLIIAFFVTSGCSVITVTHKEGDLPQVDILAGSNFCDEKFKAKVRDDELIFICRKKL